METGQPVPEPVTVGLECGMRPVQVIRTDMKGYFQFTLGAGPQSNMDISAANSAPMPTAGMPMPPASGGYRGFGGPEASLTGCELRISVAGYQPLTRMITEVADLETINVGTLRLARIAGVTGTSISVTSLLVPKTARKEFEKGDKEAHSNHLESATQHLEKAVTEYDKYAAAWNELGDIYAAGKEVEKARQAFGKAIAADPYYVPPYVGLADLELIHQEFESAVESAGKALELDPTFGVASFIQGLANFKLNRLDAAEKNALEAEKGPHQNMAGLHILLAEIYLQKQDDSNAASQMRAYLKEFPHGQYADEIAKKLQQIEKSAASADSKSTPSPAQPQTAP
jgi:Flp pilus assembly protein TadD